MISWLLYALLLGALFGLAALVAERACRRLGIAGRWMWVGAVALTLAVPVLAPVLSRPSEASVSEAVVALESTRLEPTLLASREPTLAESVKARILAFLPDLDRLRGIAGRIDRALPFDATFGWIAVTLWLIASVAMLVAIAVAAVRLVRVRRDWGLAVVDEQFVRVSDDIGPAVVGFLRGEIVVPAWALHLTADRRAMLMAHEREHLTARDPLLLALALGALVLTPWNLALWWQVRRLRLAIEMDCDRRVLRRGSDVRAYGALLIEVGRRSARTPLAAAAFSEPATHLERRITMMLARTPRWRALRAAALAIMGAGLVFVACDLQPPTGLSPEREVALSELGTNGKSFNVGEGMSLDEIRAALAMYHPELLEDQTGRKFIVQLVLDAQGNITKTGKVLDRRALEVKLREENVVRERAARATLNLAEGELEVVQDRTPVLTKVRAARQRSELVALRKTADTTRLQADRITVTGRLAEVRRARDVARDSLPEKAPLTGFLYNSRTFGRQQAELELDKIDAGLIESIEVIKGGVIGTAAPAVSGVIVIRMKF